MRTAEGAFNPEPISLGLVRIWLYFLSTTH